MPAADASAAAQARATGKPVAVPSLITETSEVLAQPDGEFELVSDATPVRVRVNGEWHAISTVLRRNADGSWSAPLTSSPVTFSGGGTGALVTVMDPPSGRQVSLSWPYPVPVPTVSGDTALYANVIPGVDLRLQATSTGYGEVLIVHSAAAAADPRMLSLAFTLRGGAGVAIRAGADGAVTAVDTATGKTLFTSGQPLMWDSAPARRLAAAASAASAGDGEIFTVPGRRTVGAVSGRSQATLTLTPFASALTSPGKLRFPLYIDPQINDSSSQYYAEVANFGGYWNTSTGTTSVGGGEVEVGDCGYSSCVYYWNGVTHYGYVNRVYFRMNTSALQKRNGYAATVYSATFSADEVGNSDGCTKQSVALYSAGSISSSTRWGGPQESELSTASSAAGGGSGCGAGYVGLGATSYLQSAANNSWPNTTFELRAPNESDEYQYKVFTDKPTLTVWYNFAPLTPTVRGVDKQVTCTSTVYTSDSTPTISATGKDNNPSPLNLDYTYALDTENTVLVKEVTLTNGGGGYASGSTAGWTAPSLTSGDGYKVDVRTSNVLPSGDRASSQTSPWSGNWHFTVLSAPPSAAPSIKSFDYPSGQWGQPQGAPGIFTVGTSGNSDIAGFAYSFDGGSGSEPVPSTSDCSYLNDGGLGTSVSSSGTGSSSGELALVDGSTAQITVPSTLTPGRHTLYARAFDDAHNASPEAAYAFYVAPDYQTATQPVTYIDGSSLVSSASGTNASLVVAQSNCCNVSWRGGSQLIFNATTAGDTFTVPITVPDAGTWQLGAEMTQASDYGDVRVDLDAATTDINLGGTATTPFDGYNPTVTLKHLDLGTQTLTQGTHTLTFTVPSHNANSAEYKLGLDYLTLSPTNRYEADTLPGPDSNTAGTLQQQCLNQAAWSDNCQLMLTNSESSTSSTNACDAATAAYCPSFTVTFDAPVESDYALGVNLTTADDYGEDEFVLDPSTSDIVLDDTASQPIDAYSASVSARYVFLGGVHLTAGTHVLKVAVTGTDGASVNNRYNAGINFLEVAPVTGATDASFTAAMNNLGIVSDNGASAGYNFDLTGASTGDNLSLQTLEAAGITPGTASGSGTSFSLNGASFTMPGLRTDSGGTVLDDNVIPDGQTVPLPAVTATGVALLVASTCGTSPAAYATVNYSGGRYTNGTIPAVGDWIMGPSSDAVIDLSYRDGGSGPLNDGQVRLYEVMLPADPNYPLASITLPVMPVSFLPGACSEALHVLAIGTRQVAAGPSGTEWTGAYAAPMDVAAPQGPAMGGETLRESVPVSSQGSGYVRVHLSNAHTGTPVTFDQVTIAASGSGPATLAAPQTVTFAGGDSVTIPAGGDVWSDAATMPSTSGGSGNLTVSMHILATDSVTTGSIHDSKNLVTYYATGNDSTNQDGSDFSSSNSLTGLYYLSEVDVSDATAGDGTIAVLGDQTATQAPAWTYGNWTADLPSAFSSAGVAVPGSIVDASTDDGLPDGWWRMNGAGLDTSSTAYDSGADAAMNLTLEGSPSWSSDNPGTGASDGSLSLNGTNQYAQTAGPVITATSSFAVSAWVKLSSLPTRNATVVAEDGSTESAFYLKYDYGAGGKWTFFFFNSDTTSPSYVSAVGPVAVAGTWTHLTGVYNASTGTIQLYVNGALAASTAFTPSWTGSGPLTVGRGLYNGAETDFFPGNISDVRAYNQLLWNYNVSQIYNDTGMSSVTAANAQTPFSDSAFEDYAAGEPNLRDVIVSLGANDVLQGASAATIEANLKALVTDVRDRYVSDEPDTQVQALITTLPPLGLPSGDPREGVREAVNSWLLNNGTTARLVLDIAGAVADSSSPNLVSPAYLTGGVPNSQYYSAIATAVASGIANSIPPVSL